MYTKIHEYTRYQSHRNINKTQCIVVLRSTDMKRPLFKAEISLEDFAGERLCCDIGLFNTSCLHGFAEILVTHWLFIHCG